LSTLQSFLSQVVNGSKPWIIIGSNSLHANMMLHRRGWPVSEVKPKMVKCASFMFACCCGRPPAVHINFSPPIFLSFGCLVLFPTSLTKITLLGWRRKYCFFKPKESFTSSTIQVTQPLGYVGTLPAIRLMKVRQSGPQGTVICLFWRLCPFFLVLSCSTIALFF
jgi:hypothetical protein